MALIQCPYCGKQISDKAQVCPKCGHYVSYGSQTPVQPNSKNNSKTIIAIIAVLLVVLIALIAGGLLYYNHVKKQRAQEDEERLHQEQLLKQKSDEEAARQDAAQRERARQDSIAAAQAREDSIKVAHNNTIDLYIAKMREFARTDEGENGEYFLYDITGNGVPELWMESTYGYGGMYVYTYSGGNLKLIYTGSGGHASYHRGKGYVVENMAHMGYQKILKLTYHHGKMKEKVLFECEEEMDEYREPSEPYFSSNSLSNESPVRNMFK